MAAGTLVLDGQKFDLLGTTAELAALLASEQAKINDSLSGRVELHFGEEDVSMDLLLRGRRRKRKRAA